MIYISLLQPSRKSLIKPTDQSIIQLYPVMKAPQIMILDYGKSEKKYDEFNYSL
jgi:hypothetical protein